MEIVPFLRYLHIHISAVTKSLMVDSTIKLSKQDWKKEQQADTNIGPIIS